MLVHIPSEFYCLSTRLILICISMMCTLTTLYAQNLTSLSDFSYRNQQQQLRLSYLKQLAFSHRDHHGHAIWHSAQALDRESFGSFNIKQITMNLDIDEFDFPQEAGFVVLIEITEPTSQLNLLAFLQQPQDLITRYEEGMVIPSTFEIDEDQAILRINFDQPLPVNSQIEILMQSTVNFDQSDPVSCYNDLLALHCIQPYILPLNYEYYSVDLFKTKINLQVNQRGIYPSAVGQIIARPPLADRGVGFWSYKTDYMNLLPAFTLGSVAPVSYNDWIEFFPAVGYEQDLINYFGTLTESIINFYGDLYFPYPYGRFAISTLSSDAGVALGPMANIFIPSDFWFIVPDEYNELQFIFDGLISHELGHQYFYNWAKLNEFSQAWLSESFAEYSSLRYMNHSFQNDDNRRFNYWNYIKTVPPNDELPIASDDVSFSDYYFSIVYLRGSNLIYQIASRMRDFDIRLAELVESHQEEFLYSVDLLDLFQLLTPKPEYRDFDIDKFVEIFLLDTYRLAWSCYATYIDENVSRLYFDSNVRYNDQVYVDALGFADEDFYFSLNDFNTLTHTAQGIQLDPNLLFFRTITQQQAGDIDLNGVVDGLDALQVLSLENTFATEIQWQEGIDQNQDDFIDRVDLEILLEEFGSVYQD